MTVEGEWSGEYRYDDPSRPAVTFRLALQRGPLWRLRGVVQDGVGGMPEEGRVVGWSLGRRLRFRKLMPVARVSAESGTQPLSEWVASRGEFAIPPDTPHTPILYRGLVAMDGLSANGTWHIAAHQLALVGGQHVLQFPASHGSWSAQRV